MAAEQANINCVPDIETSWAAVGYPIGYQSLQRYRKPSQLSGYFHYLSRLICFVYSATPGGNRSVKISKILVYDIDMKKHLRI